MSCEQFWELIDLCRAHSATTQSFVTYLEVALAKLASEELYSFHNWVRHYVDELQFKCGYNDPSNIGFNDRLNDCLTRHMDLPLGGDRGECYVGWVISQGRTFYELLRDHPERAADRLPTWEDVWQGENVLFLAIRIFRNRTGQELLEVFEKGGGEE
jgi:hypothetical protein